MKNGEFKTKSTQPLSPGFQLVETLTGLTLMLFSPRLECSFIHFVMCSNCDGFCEISCNIDLK